MQRVPDTHGLRQSQAVNTRVRIGDRPQADGALIGDEAPARDGKAHGADVRKSERVARIQTVQDTQGSADTDSVCVLQLLTEE